VRRYTLACSAGADDLIKWLIKKGADVTAIDASGDTPAHLIAPWAAVRPLTMDRLRRAGGNVHARNARGETPAVLAEKAVELHASRKRAAEDKRQSRRDADVLDGGLEGGGGGAAAVAAAARAAERAWNAKLYGEVGLYKFNLVDPSIA
jgi:NF-kappa-B inhibitor-like protein 1